MDWMLSTAGMGIIAALIVIVAWLIYWKREPIKKWFAKKQVGVTIKAGPVEVSLADKEKPEKAADIPAGVDFGEGGDFTGATIKGVGSTTFSARDKIARRPSSSVGTASGSRRGWKSTARPQTFGWLPSQNESLSLVPSPLAPGRLHGAASCCHPTANGARGRSICCHIPARCLLRQLLHQKY